MDRLQSLTVFARVAEMESFTAAANSLGLPKATTSLAVQQLEERLGARLLHRTTRRVRLTNDGAAFYERCKDLLSDSDELETMFKNAGETLTGRIRVDMSTRMARFQVIPALPKFLAEHPGLELELGSTDRFVDLVREGYDCVVRVGAVADSGLVARKLGEMPLINCCSPGYLKKFGRPRGLRDLEKHWLIGYAGTLGQNTGGFEYPDGAEFKELPMRTRITVNNAEAYVAAAVAGLGLIQVPSHGLHYELRNRQLVEVLPQLRPRPMPVNIIYPHRRQLSRRVRVFIEWLEQVLKVQK
jgi:DNA-binding transcriptional LysR family regulator